MAKFLVIQDYKADGTNIVPIGSEIPNFLLTYVFYKDETVEGIISDGYLIVNTNSGILRDGSVYNGNCVFYIPAELVKLMDAEEVSPMPAEEVVDILPPPVLPEYVEEPRDANNIPIQTDDIQPLIPVVEYIQIKKKKKKNEEFIILGVFLVLLLVVILSKC